MPPVSVIQLLKAAPFLIAMVALAVLSGCNLCKDEVLEKVASPDGKRVAIILTRDCGATTSEYIAVNLQDAKQRRLDEENDVFVTKLLHPLHVFWQGNDSLTVDCENCNLGQASKKLEKRLSSGYIPAVNNGNGTVTFQIPNTAGTHSFFLHLVPDIASCNPGTRP